MKFCKNLFIGKSIDNQDEIVNVLKKRISILNLYLICISEDSKNLMEIMKSNEIFKTINKHKNYTIIGIANGKIEAFNLVKDILQLWYNNNDNFSRFKFDCGR